VILGSLQPNTSALFLTLTLSSQRPDGAEMFVNSFHDLDEGYELQTVIRRNEGDEIVFDFWHSGDEQTYTVKDSPIKSAQAI
jgi:hypothetical protein